MAERETSGLLLSGRMVNDADLAGGKGEIREQVVTLAAASTDGFDKILHELQPPPNLGLISRIVA